MSGPRHAETRRILIHTSSFMESPTHQSILNEHDPCTNQCIRSERAPTHTWKCLYISRGSRTCTLEPVCCNKRKSSSFHDLGSINWYKIMPWYPILSIKIFYLWKRKKVLSTSQLAAQLDEHVCCKKWVRIGIPWRTQSAWYSSGLKLLCQKSKYEI